MNKNETAERLIYISHTCRYKNLKGFHVSFDDKDLWNYGLSVPAIWKIRDLFISW